MNNNLTELRFILDRSGSMSGLESDTVGGFNGMIEKQRRTEGQVLVSTVLFDNDSQVIHDRVPLDGIRPMTLEDYTVGGCTALLDAIGGAVHHISNVHRYIREEDRPAHTLFVIMTDGMENASRKYSSDKVKRMIEQKKETGWEFLFLGANIDAVETASRIGIARNRAADYRCDSRGTRTNYDAVGCAITSLRCEKAIRDDWSASIDEDFNARKEDTHGKNRIGFGKKHPKAST